MDARPNVRSDAIAVAASKLEHKLLLSSGSTSPVHVLGRRVSLGPSHQNIAPVKISAPGHAGVEARQIDRMAGAQGIEHIIGQTIILQIEIALQSCGCMYDWAWKAAIPESLNA